MVVCQPKVQNDRLQDWMKESGQIIGVGEFAHRGHTIADLGCVRRTMEKGIVTVVVYSDPIPREPQVGGERPLPQAYSRLW